MMREKKGGNSFWLGLVTGLIIALFITAVVFIVRVISGAGNTDPRTERIARGLASESTASASEKTGESSEGKSTVVAEGDKEEQGTGETTEEDKPAVVEDGYVLDNADVLKKIDTIEEMINKHYIEGVDNETLEKGIYSGMMDSLGDPYARYYDPEEWIEAQQDFGGIYYGIGVYLTKDEKYFVPRVTGVIKNTPAEEMGMQEDDLIVTVDGVDIYDYDLSDAVKLIKGAQGTYAHLEIVRGEGADRKVLELDVERRKVETPTVYYEDLGDGIAYIAISEFDDVTAPQFSEALQEARDNNMKGMVLDLRSNPGGSVYAAVDIARMLLPAGLVVYTEDKYGQRIEYDCDGAHELEVPMMVLVNKNTASSAEILSGAIKDHKKGKLIGTTTFGKGIVQNLYQLEDGSAIKMTTSSYFTPNGHNIHKIGIEPDIELEFDPDANTADGTDNQLERAKDELKKEMQ